MNEERVRDVMRKGVVSCAPNLTLREAAKLMAEAKVRALVVIDEHCALAGILSQSDLVNATLAQRDTAQRDTPRWQETMVCEAMTQDVLTVTPDTPLSEAAKILVDNNVHRLVVIDNQRSSCSPVGVLSVGDIMRRLTGEQ
jgi:CBS domain-containing protein